MAVLLLFTAMVGIGAGFVVVRRKRKAGTSAAVTH